MEQYDLQQLGTAIEYVKRMANGNNPVNNAPLPDNETLNNPNIIRCMFFVRDVLQSVYRNNGIVGGKDRIKQKTGIQQFPEEALNSYTYREDQGINRIISQLYEPVADRVTRKVSAHSIVQRLEANGYITTEFNEEIKKEIRVPTEKGIAIGMRLERKEYINGGYPNVYYTIIYNQQAQEHLISIFMRLINGEAVE